METNGNETLYELSADEAYPVLVLREADQKLAGEPGVVAVPERLVKQLQKARAAEREASHEIARWVKYGPDETAKADIRQIIDELPTTEDWKKDRKRR